MKADEKIEHKKNRTTEIVVAVVGGLFLVIVTLINSFKSSSSSPTITTTVKDNKNSPISRDIQTQNNYFLNSSTDSNKRNNTSPATRSDIKAKNTFKVFPSNVELEMLISANNYILAKRDITYYIEITFDGEIENVQNNLYRFNGGNPLIKINGKRCSIISELMITPTFNGGNNKQNVLNEINEKISELISQHTTAIYKKIMQCLK